MLADLKKRNGFIDGVVVSGGEPTIDSGLPAFLTQMKELGLQVKLDTNGLRPDVVADLLDQQLLDYVAVDIKTSLERYSELHTMPVDIDALRKTVGLLRKSEIETEFRTTCIPHLVGDVEIKRMGELLRGVSCWVLQQYVPDHAMTEEWQHFDVYPAGQIEAYAEQAKGYVDQVQVRGI